MHLFSLVYIDTAEWSWRENKLCSGGMYKASVECI
jgi:hypothetical protein